MVPVDDFVRLTYQPALARRDGAPDGEKNAACKKSHSWFLAHATLSFALFLYGPLRYLVVPAV